MLDNLADKLSIPHKDVQDLGYINNKPLVFDNEPARHKLIDVIGDLALIGKPIRGRVIATRPGHKINNQLARMIRKDIKLNEVQAPVYDPNSTPVMDINRIRELLPHRYPFLLVDKIIEIGGNYIVGVKNIKMCIRDRVPGVGAQGGSLAEVAQYGMNDQCGLLVNLSLIHI